MKHFKLTSEAFAGSVDIYFSDNGQLSGFDTEGASLSEKQQKWILLNMPIHIDELQRIIGTSPTARLTEIVQDITFEMFWNRYDDKVVTSKKRTRIAWNKLSNLDQVKAYNYIQRYFLNLPGGTRKKYPESYLNSFMWNN